MATRNVKMNLNGWDRMDFSKSTQPLAERIISTVVPDAKEFTWCNDFEDLENLDIEHGIDLLCKMNQGQLLTFGVKVLTKDYTSITIEVSGVDKHGDEKKGNWYSDKNMYSLVIYSFDGVNIERWAMIDNGRLAMASNRWKLNWSKKNNSVGYSAFKYIEFEQILEFAPDAVMFYGGEWGSNLLEKKVYLF